jgi:hypothetical protein
MEVVLSDSTTDVTPEIAPDVPEEVPAEVPAEVPDAPDLQAVQASNPPRVRKVRIKEAPPQKANHVYWGDRLQEHRTNQRLAKNERYGNLRIM